MISTGREQLYGGSITLPLNTALGRPRLFNFGFGPFGMLTPEARCVLTLVPFFFFKSQHGLRVLQEQPTFSNRGEENKVSWRREELNTHEMKGLTCSNKLPYVSQTVNNTAKAYNYTSNYVSRVCYTATLTLFIMFCFS